MLVALRRRCAWTFAGTFPLSSTCYPPVTTFVGRIVSLYSVLSCTVVVVALCGRFGIATAQWQTCSSTRFRSWYGSHRLSVPLPHGPLVSCTGTARCPSDSEHRHRNGRYHKGTNAACHWATLQATTPVATDPQPGRFPLRPRRHNSADITGCGRMNLILVARAAEASSAGRSRPRVSVSPSLAGPPGPSRLCGSLHAAPKRSRGGAGSGWCRMLY